MSDLTWTNEKRKLSDLVPWSRNPRQIRKAEAERLRQSLEEFGQIHPIAIAPDGTILDGHQRQQVWSATKRFGPDYEVDVRVASRQLTEREHQKLVAILHAGAVGSWDWDALASWSTGDLAEWGFDGD
ncbi:MAG: ParB N-terminal domain-containing protein, partial [Anaerolineales bacterium]|nr:ParB N-terminal domain-containing protein [Anaerolineales bacterium]